MGGGSTQNQETRYAPYLETAHQEFLGDVNYNVDFILNATNRSSPYVNYPDISIDCAFFGAGYVLCSFPSLYDMFGKFMAGLDVEVLFDEVFEETINGTVVNNLIGAEADILRDDLDNEAYPAFDAGMRDINSVMSSTFVVGHSIMEANRTKAISRFSVDMRAKLLPIVTERWRTHLDWNRSVIEMYAQLLKFYFAAKMDVDNHNIEMEAKNTLWPFTVLDYNRIAIGTLTGAQNIKSDVSGASSAAKALGGALTGAASGAMIGATFGASGGPIGMGIGAAIGLAAGLL